MNKLAIIADDHTGACDSGVHFAKVGRKMALLLDQEDLGPGVAALNGIALSTESRFLEAAEAAERVYRAIDWCCRAGFDRFFKKIDSTMRGNPGSEIEAAIAATGSEAALMCTAMPETGRTCVDGLILVEGNPLHKTDIGRDPFNPLTTSSVVDLLAQQTDLKAGHLPLADLRAHTHALESRVKAHLADGCRIIIADAITRVDLRTLGTVLKNWPSLLPAGAGGLAEGLAGALSDVKADRAIRPWPTGLMLAVVGSLAGASLTQAEAACDSGRFHKLELDVSSALADPDRETSRLVAEARQFNNKHLLLRPQPMLRQQIQSRTEGERVAELLGHMARAVCKAVPCEILFSTGGSTSMGVARAMGIKIVSLEEELLPGVVLGSCIAADGSVRWFITKAGGFGDEQTLMTLADSFNPNPSKEEHPCRPDPSSE